MAHAACCQRLQLVGLRALVRPQALHRYGNSELLIYAAWRTKRSDCKSVKRLILHAQASGVLLKAAAACLNAVALPAHNAESQRAQSFTGNYDCSWPPSGALRVHSRDSCKGCTAAQEGRDLHLHQQAVHERSVQAACWQRLGAPGGLCSSPAHQISGLRTLLDHRAQLLLSQHRWEIATAA